MSMVTDNLLDSLELFYARMPDHSTDVKPRILWLEERYDTLVNAMNKYIANKQDIPWRWVAEYKWLFDELQNKGELNESKL